MISGESEISGRVTFRGLTRANLFRFLASDFSFGFENEKKSRDNSLLFCCVLNQAGSLTAKPNN